MTLVNLDSVNALNCDNMRQEIRKNYAKVAIANSAGSCCGTVQSCCGASNEQEINSIISSRLGYSEDELNKIPEGADLGLGCGNPQAIASIKNGEVVLDLGSGAGFDCFLAAAQVGENGLVIGVDMTPDMLSKARANASKGKYKNVEFRLGEIENLPVADSIVNVIISNCVINLSPNKPQVFREALRVLKTGGRLAISDVVAIKDIPEEIKKDPALISGCIGNASLISDLEEMLISSGFIEIKISIKEQSKEFIKDWTSTQNIIDYVRSATITAIKPANKCC